MMQKKILIIDDDEEMCSEITDILRDTGYYVMNANDGIKGAQMLGEDSYDILLLDLKVPNLSGYEILKMIRERKISVKVLVMTGRPNLQNIQRELSPAELEEEKVLKTAGRVIQKPFMIEDLIDAVEKLSRVTP
jgi:DNA-binding response OmpR family regulator